MSKKWYKIHVYFLTVSLCLYSFFAFSLQGGNQISKKTIQNWLLLIGRVTKTKQWDHCIVMVTRNQRVGPLHWQSDQTMGKLLQWHGDQTSESGTTVLAVLPEKSDNGTTGYFIITKNSFH